MIQVGISIRKANPDLVQVHYDYDIELFKTKYLSK